MRTEAKHYTSLGNGSIACALCPHNCKISEGKQGICGVRKAENGRLYTSNYGEISSIGIDPIEKKPLYHFKPGRHILSVGSFGCNFRCGFCQNYRISMEMPETRNVSPEELVKLAIESKIEDNVGIAFTYNEPSIWYEYVYDTSKLCKENGMNVVLVTNGYINREPLLEITDYVDALNIDLKSFNDKYYKEVCKGDVASVMSTIEEADKKCHVEITTLLVNGYNDSDEEVEKLSKWIASINPDMPLHLSRYYPTYKFTASSTPVERITKCAEIARQHLHFVYVGNVMGIDNNTYCYNCGEILIDRSGYVAEIFMKTDKCPECGEHINVIL